MSGRGKQVLLLLTFLGPLAAYGGTIAYAWYLRSHAYHRRIEADVSAWMGMPVSFERLEPLSFHGQAFNQISARLWEKGPQVFSCRRAVWMEQLIGDEPGYHLHLRGGWLVVGTADWRRYEYERLIAAGLQHDFAELGLRRVRLEEFDLRWVQDDVELRAGKAAGVIDFSPGGAGEARLTCGSLNGQPVSSPISILARFTSGAALEFSDVELTIPQMTFDGAGLDPLLGGPVHSGEVSGTLRFQPREGVPGWKFSGWMRGADLSELTRRIPGGPYAGLAHLDVDAVEVVGRKLHILDCRGEIVALRPGQIWPAVDPQQSSRLHLNVRQMRLEGNVIRHLSASGFLADLALEPISGLVGRGRINGIAEVVIRSIVITDDCVEYADLDVNISPPPGQAGFLDRQVLATGAKELLGVDLSSMLPERVEYVRLGARLRLEGDQLHVFGTHGYENLTLLTIRVFDREIGIVRQPDRAFTVPEPLAWLKARSRKYDAEDVRNWWRYGRFLSPPLDLQPPATPP